MIKEIIVRVISGLIIIAVILIGIYLLIRFVLIPAINIKLPTIIKEFIKI